MHFLETIGIPTNNGIFQSLGWVLTLQLVLRHGLLGWMFAWMRSVQEISSISLRTGVDKPGFFGRAYEKASAFRPSITYSHQLTQVSYIQAILLDNQ